MIPDMYSNPFVECTARDMEYRDILKYWCQPYDYFESLDEYALFHNTTPIFIEGARGSGKTMLLKYLSYFCQKEENYQLTGSSLLKQFQRQGSLGIYYRFKNDFGKLLAALNCTEITKREIFEEYFQLYYSRELVLVLLDLADKHAIDSDTSERLVIGLNNIFTTNYAVLADFLHHINLCIEKIDQLIRKLKYIRDITTEIGSVLSGQLRAFSIFALLRKEISEWNNLTLLILIDEYENINSFQKTVNTFIKQTDAESGITYRIGMRPEGITTYATFVGDEQLQVGRDYLSMQLRVTNPKKFQRFLKTIAAKRLSRSPFFAEHRLTKIEKILGVREDWVNEAVEAVESRPNITFECVDPRILEYYPLPLIKSKLSYPDNPLIEMLNILWINRGKTLEDTHHAMNVYLNTKNKRQLRDIDSLGNKYFLDYEMKYKYSLLFALLAKCSVRKKYYSFTTFSYLSCGSVNDFLSLCRNTFMAMDSKSYDALLKGEPIPKEVQDRGARAAASEQLDKIRLCEDSGTAMYTFVMNIGEVFSHYHRDLGIQYPETNQFAFENEAEIKSRHLLKRDLNHMIKWGVIEKKHNLQRISIGRRKGDLYYLNRLLAPIFGISYRTRGGYNFVIKTTTFEQMLSNSMEASSIISQNKKKGKQSSDSLLAQQTISGQLSFFGGELDG